MSRFADPTKTDVYTLPDGCQCPDQPHETDWIRIRTEAGSADMLSIADNDNPVGILSALATEWNLVDNDGKPAPLTKANIDRLFTDGFPHATFRAWINEHVQASSLGKGHAGRSPTGTPASNFPIRPNRQRRRSTKS